MKNILVTAIGSFAGDVVIKNLRKAGCKVIGCDIYNKEWIVDAYNVDQFFQAPPVSDEKAYLEFITEICKEQDIDYIFPLTDIEVDFYHRNRRLFSSLEICPCISCETAIEICRNKMKLDEFLRNREICQTIPTRMLENVEIKNLDYPVVVKPFNGRSSQGLHYIDTYEQMQYFVSQNDVTDYIVQPKISGEILTVDVIRNQNTSTSGCIVRKELLRTMNGAGTSVKVFRNQELEKICINIANALNINGCVNFEFIEDENRIYHLIECNPRFSGGVEFSCMSGYDFVINHLKCFEKKEIDLLSNVQEQFIARKYEEFITEIVYND